MKTLVCSLVLMFPIVSPRAETPAAESPKQPTERVAFAQYCFWTGEMKLGQIEGVVRTEAGFFKGREVTLVNYDPSRISLEKLASQARQAGVADCIYLSPGARPGGTSVARVKVGAALDPTYRAAPASDQKKQLEGTPYARLKLTPEQATKVNAFVRVNPDKASEWLAPAQRASLAASR
jgi:hypothetical protein